MEIDFNEYICPKCYEKGDNSAYDDFFVVFACIGS